MGERVRHERSPEQPGQMGTAPSSQGKGSLHNCASPPPSGKLSIATAERTPPHTQTCPGPEEVYLDHLATEKYLVYLVYG